MRRAPPLAVAVRAIVRRAGGAASRVRAASPAHVVAAGAALLGVPATSGAEPDGLDEVVVTATRAPVRDLDYAGSASRLDADAIAALGATHSSELLNRAPGSFLQRGSGQEVLVALRSPVLTGAGACGAVLVLEDGVPIRPVGFCNVNQLFEVNLEQAAAVEVLRGPGVGVLGANAVHGVINVLGPRPTDLPQAAVSVEAGSDAWRQVAVAGAGTADRTDAGLVAHLTRDGGHRVDAGFHEWKANAVAERRLEHATVTVRLAATDLDQQTAGFVVGENAYRDRALSRSNADPEAYRRAHSARASVRYSGSAVDATAYARTSRMEFLQHFLLGQPIEENGQHSGGAMLAWRGSRGTVDWSAGLDLELARGELSEVQPAATTGGSPAANAIRPAGRHYDYVVDTRVVAPWTLIEWQAASRLRLTAALRGDRVRYDYDTRMPAGNTAEDGTRCPAGGCLYSRPADRTDSFTNVAPRLGLAWRVAEDHGAYASAARGFRPPEVTELYRLQRQQSVADLAAEEITAYELGLRGTWRGERQSVRYDVAVYAMDKRNAILRDSAGYNVADGRTRHRGVEYEFAWSPRQWLTASATGSRALHTYRFDRTIEGGETIRAGNDVDTAPRELLTFRAAVRPTARMRAELEWVHVGPYFADAANLHRYPGHDLLNVRAGIELPRGFDLRARVLNVANRAYADRADFAFGSWRYFPGRGRTWFLEIGYANRGRSR